MQDNKINFSSDEIQLMSNQDFFKQKLLITQKIVDLFQKINLDIELIKNADEYKLPESGKIITGKISKGENYLGLPYIVLDNPRIFSKENIFAFRTMFWWGNYFSFTFHLSGKFLEDFKDAILTNFDSLKNKQFLICTHHEQWIHHLEKENYTSVDSLEKKDIKLLIEKNVFFKLSRKSDIKKWNQIPDFALETLKEYLTLISL